MNRRDFIMGTGTGLGAVWPGSKRFTASAATTAGKAGILTGGQAEKMSEHSSPSERTYHLLGVPLRTGSLYPGNENDAQAYREVQLLARLQAVGCKALDEGDVAIPSYLPHHSIPRSGAGRAHASPGTASAIASSPTCNSSCMSRC